MRSLNICLVVSLNSLLNKLSSCRGFDATTFTWCRCDVICFKTACIFGYGHFTKKNTDNWRPSSPECLSGFRCLPHILPCPIVFNIVLYCTAVYRFPIAPSFIKIYFPYLVNDAWPNPIPINHRGWVTGAYIDGLVQDCTNSNALAMELLQACTEPSICKQ